MEIKIHTNKTLKTLTLTELTELTDWFILTLLCNIRANNRTLSYIRSTMGFFDEDFYRDAEKKQCQVDAFIDQSRSTSLAIEFNRL